MLPWLITVAVPPLRTPAAPPKMLADAMPFVTVPPASSSTPMPDVPVPVIFPWLTTVAAAPVNSTPSPAAVTRPVKVLVNAPPAPRSAPPNIVPLFTTARADSTPYE